MALQNPTEARIKSVEIIEQVLQRYKMFPITSKWAKHTKNGAKQNNFTMKNKLVYYESLQGVSTANSIQSGRERTLAAFELRKRDGLSQRGSRLLQPIHCRQTLYLYAWPSQHYTHARALGQYRFVVRMTQPQDAKLNDYISQEDTMTAIHVL